MADSTEGIHTDFSEGMSYGDYLQLDTLLSAQSPLTAEHDELLFITIHQVMELWLKLLNRELDTALDHIRADRAPARLQMHRPDQPDPGTADPGLDRALHHDAVRLPELPAGARRSSGFQSWQYRLVEFKLGAKDAVEDGAAPAPRAISRGSSTPPIARRASTMSALRPAGAARLCGPGGGPRPRPDAALHGPSRRRSGLGGNLPPLRAAFRYSTNSPKNWWIWRMRSSNGASGT